MSLLVSTHLSLPNTPTPELETQLGTQIILCGHNCLFSVDLLGTRHHAWKQEKPLPAYHSGCASLSSPDNHKIPFPSQMRADISGGGWYTNSVGRLRTYATVLETKAGRGWFPVSHKNVNLNNNKRV